MCRHAHSLLHMVLTVNIITPAKGVMFSTALVSLFDCLRKNNTAEAIFKKVLGKVAHGPRNKLIDVGGSDVKFLRPSLRPK